MLGTLAALFAALNGAWSLISNLFGKKAPVDENTQAVEVANRAGAVTATEARDTRAAINQELADNAKQTETDVAIVRSAGSLQDGADTLTDAIARANSHTGTNS